FDVLGPDLPPIEEGVEPEEETIHDGYAFDDGHPAATAPRAVRDSDFPMQQWQDNHRETFVKEVVRLSGRGGYRRQQACDECATPDVPAIHRCKDCFTDALFCSGCIVALHVDNPFHWIESWDGFQFVDKTLNNLGLRIQLGHGPQRQMPQRYGSVGGEKAAKKTFCVVDSNGVHEVGVDFCICQSAQDADIQLLRARLYPTTSAQPSSAATIRILRKFHISSFESKCSAFEFYNGLARETDNTGTFQPRDRYAEFLRITRQWRNIQQIVRHGAAHSAGGIPAIKAGACALLCPACPQPGKNCAPGWRDLPPERRFLYALFLAIDANFRMKRKNVSSEDDDPGLGDGWAFYCKVQEYMDHLGTHWNLEQEKSTCVSHDAVDQPDRESRGTASSGIGTVDCARHNMKRPNGVGDLQKGERYINMDYMFWKSLAGHDELLQLFWHKNIWKRLSEYDVSLQDRAGHRYFVFLIPKFHLPAHIESCNILFSFELTPFVGRTDGEAPERGWANANPLAASTKEMGPGSRRDTIDDHFNDWNWKKTIALGSAMLGKIKKAAPEMVEKRLALDELVTTLPPTAVAEWKQQIELWERDASKPNPFQSTQKHESMQAIRTRMAVTSQTAVEGDAEDEVRGDMHVSEMIAMGMQLEEQQRTLKFDKAAAKAHTTDGQKTTMQERANKLRRKILPFCPEVARLRAAEDQAWARAAVLQPAEGAEDQARARAAVLKPTAGVEVHDMELWLPSKLCRTPGVEKNIRLAGYEFDLRKGQAHEALEDLRKDLLVRTHMYKSKDKYVRGVAANTRSNEKISGVDERIRRLADQYRAARRALESLSFVVEDFDWKTELRPLHAEDVRGMPRAQFSDPERKKKKNKRGPEAEARRKEAAKPMSWIWVTQGLSSGNANPAMDEALRLEWAKTRVKSMRWTEEVDLLEVEMWRILQFLRWRRDWWQELLPDPDLLADLSLKEGYSAYAHRQTTIHDGLRERFAVDWKDVAVLIAAHRAQLGTIPAEDEQAEDEHDEDKEGDESEEEMDEGAERDENGGDDEEPVPVRAVDV
ncbi:hypothetical protein C8J57DRAFT_1564870, partial [Mycena rebaudengoi]